MDNLPLSGIRVAEFTWVIAGPLMTKTLAVLGAEVIRIESAKRAEFRDRSVNFTLLNNNKKSCSLDLSQPRGRELAKEIIKGSDIVVENFGYGVMDRLGLSYEVLCEVKADIIMLSCSGLGRTGPEKDKLAYGTLLQLFSGWSLLQGSADTADIPIGGAWTDPLTAATGTFALLAALYHRENTGEGQYIDLSMAEATICGIPDALMDYSMNKRLHGRLGNSDVIAAPHECFPCKGDDQWIAISVSTEGEWGALRGAMGNPDWSCDEKFADMFLRKRNEGELNRLIGAWTASQTTAEVMCALQSAGVPAGPSMSVRDLMTDPHLGERGIFPRMDAPEKENQMTIGVPWRIQPGFTPSYRSAPTLGQDNDYVFKALLGLSDAEVAELADTNVLH